MALSGVRSSWLMLARNCDLCWLASASWRLLSWISSNSRTFSIAITAWSAKVVDQLDLLVGERPHVVRVKTITPIGSPSRSSGTPSMVRKPPTFCASARCIPDRPVRRECERSCLPAAAARRRFRDPAEIGWSCMYSLILGRKAVTRDVIDRLRLFVGGTHAPVRLAKSRGRFDQRVEHGLQIEGRAADDLEHIGGGGLLLQEIRAAR